MSSKNSNGKSYGSGRTRNYATVVYPDSAPENWIETLSECFIPAFISPIHDKDTNPTGEVKKAHYHVILMFDTVKTKEQAIDVFNKVNGVGCEVVNNLRSMARYLCHLDNPDKYQYSKDDVISLCGADYLSIIGSASDKYLALAEMMDFCEKYNVNSFAALARYSQANRNDWFRVLTDSGSVFMREYLKSRKWSQDENCLHIIDPETGETIL